MCLSDEQLTAVSGSLLRKDAPLYQSKPFFVFTPENPSGGPLICLKCGTHLLSGSYLGEVLRSVSILQRPVLSNEPRERAAELQAERCGHWMEICFLPFGILPPKVTSPLRVAFEMRALDA